MTPLLFAGHPPCNPIWGPNPKGLQYQEEHVVKHLPSPQQVPMESINQVASKETKSGLYQEPSNISWQYPFLYSHGLMKR